MKLTLAGLMFLTAMFLSAVAMADQGGVCAAPEGFNSPSGIYSMKPIPIASIEHSTQFAMGEGGNYPAQPGMSSMGENSNPPSCAMMRHHGLWYRFWGRIFGHHAKMSGSCGCPMRSSGASE